MPRVFVAILFVASLFAKWSTSCPGDGPQTAVVIDHGRGLVVVGSQSGIDIRSLPDLEILRQGSIDLENIHDLALSPDGTCLLVAGGAPSEAGEVELLSWPELERLRRVELADDVVYAVAWSADGSKWASASANGECSVISSNKGEVLCRYRGHSRPVQAICFCPDNATILSASLDQTVRVWDATTGQTHRTLDNHTSGVNDLVVRLPDRENDSLIELFSIGDDRTVRLWQPTIGRLVRFARLPTVPRSIVAVEGDSRQLVIGCDDGRVRVLDYDSLSVTAEIEGSVGRIFDLCLTGDLDVIVAGEKGVRFFSHGDFLRRK